MAKTPEYVIQDLKKEAIQKVFGRKWIKIYPEDFLPRKIKNILNSTEHLDEAESKINAETAEKYRKLKRVCRKKSPESII